MGPVLTLPQSSIYIKTMLNYNLCLTLTLALAAATWGDATAGDGAGGDGAAVDGAAGVPCEYWLCEESATGPYSRLNVSDIGLKVCVRASVVRAVRWGDQRVPANDGVQLFYLTTTSLPL